ncbi:hypothetical protein [Rubellicoccus peritrichatus]|uniref:Uncharacterized protein n=1 Tax=Rubellicoccus peritrichatus TaxID=3080537 RepID=A0AAQ3QUU4_9BACT|nr:hypothetical protein [Puniceicoccus sp. CR14]WOO40157.1 hypothetical protein RZN69_16165 [Puniceicoccus sp. CR14]
MDNDLEKLTELCIKLGSPEKQAQVMAAQMIKRADQIAIERKTTRVAALDHLLRILISGREGQVPVDDPPKEG